MGRTTQNTSAMDQWEKRIQTEKMREFFNCRKLAVILKKSYFSYKFHLNRTENGDNDILSEEYHKNSNFVQFPKGSRTIHLY